MGQAKKRGTFEERKAAAIAKKAAEVERRRQAHLAYERSLTPVQKMRRHELRAILAMAAAHTHVVGVTLKNS